MVGLRSLPPAPGSSETPGRSRRRLAAPLVVLLFVISATGAALLYARHRGASTIGLPLQAVARVALPAPSSRFDYAELDSAAHRLFLAQLGASRLLEIDTDTRRVVSVTGALADVHGVIVVPAVRRVFVTATGSNQLVALDEVTGAEEFRAPTGDYPDGLVYVPSTGQVWISNETGRSETVVDATTGASVGTVPLGGEAGNVRYDARSDRVLVDVQTANVVAVIDPRSRRILSRASVPGCDHAHGLVLDPAGTRAFVACDGNARLVVLSLPDLRPLGHFPVGDAPDVLALDEPVVCFTSPPSPASSPPLTSTLHRGGSLDGPAWATTLTSLLSIRPRGRRSFLSSATRGRPRCLLPSPAEPAGGP